MQWKHRLAALALAAAGTALAGDIGREFTRAAQLHRNGETPAAMSIWQHCAEQGNADCAYNLGIVLQHGDGTARNPRQALHWFKAAAERGDKPAAYQAGLMLLNGDGVPADADEAHRWFILPRQHHAHHGHSPQMQAWRERAAELIRQRDLRETLLAGRGESDKVIAGLRRRAGLPPAEGMRLATH